MPAWQGGVLLESRSDVLFSLDSKPFLASHLDLCSSLYSNIQVATHERKGCSMEQMILLQSQFGPLFVGNDQICGGFEHLPNICEGR